MADDSTSAISDIRVRLTAWRPAATSAAVRGVVQAVLATVCWSTSSIMIDRLDTLYHLSALQISTWRVLMATVIVALIILARGGSGFTFSARDVPYYVVCGIVGISISYVTWAASIQINKPAAAAALSFSAPAFVAIGDRLVFGTRLHRLLILAIVIDLLGCGLVAGIQHPAELVRSPLGLMVGTGNGLAFSIYTLFGRGLGRTEARDPWTVLFYIFVFGAIGLCLGGAVAAGPGFMAVHLDARGWLLMVALALVPTIGGYALYNASLTHLSATIATLVITFEPPMVALFAFIALGRTVRPIQVVGIGMIVGGVVLLQVGSARLRRRQLREA